MKTLFCSLLLITGTCFSQTKKIAFKSHSGSAAHYAAALHNELFDMNFSNFGQAPNPVIKYAILDSLIFVSDTEAVLVTSSHCINRYQQTSTVWKEGREKAYAHPLFSQKHSLDSIKSVLKNQYHFRNNIDSVTFVGYDNAKAGTSGHPSSSGLKRENNFPVAAISDKKPPRSNYPYILLGIVGAFSLVVALTVRKINKLQSGI